MHQVVIFIVVAHSLFIARPSTASFFHGSPQHQVSLEVHLRLDIIDGIFSFAEHIQCTVASDVHLSTKVLALIHFFLLQSGKLQGGRADGRKALLLSLLLTECGCLGQALLVHLGNEWVKLLLGLPQVALCCLLLLVL